LCDLLFFEVFFWFFEWKTMSAYDDDDFSDESFDGSSSADGNEEPPTLDEVLFDMSLFKLFVAYMKSHNGVANLTFLKQTRLLRIYNAPRAVWLTQAIKHIWTFFAECAPMPVTVSDDVRKKLQEMSLDPEKEANLDKDSFSVAFGEVYNAVVPHFQNWISTNEWRDAIPFQRLAPPTFNIVLTSKTLRVLFNKYIKNLATKDSDATVQEAYHLWKFCVIANDFRDGNYSHAAHIERKKKHERTESTSSEKSRDGEKAKEDSTEGGKPKELNPEDYARRLTKKYKHHLGLPYDGTIPYAVYIVRALDHAIETFEKSSLFVNWILLKQYLGVDYQAKVVHQTLDADGYVEPPTVAGAMTSSMLPFILILLSGSENGMNLEFLVDVLKFHRAYANSGDASSSHSMSVSHGGSVHSVSSASGSASTDPSRREMVDEARRIFAKYLETGEMYCDPKLVEEVRAALSKSGGRGVTANMFRRCGAFIYQRTEHSWARETRGNMGWANKSFENRCRAARAIEEEFSMKVLPEGIDLQIVPNIDDVLQCPELSQDFGEFCGKQVASSFAAWQKAYGEYFQAPIHQRKAILMRLVEAFGGFADAFPPLQPLHSVFEKEANKRERISDSVIMHCTAAGIRAIAQRYLFRWLVEHSMKWKSVPWTPVSTILFSDLTMAYGMGTIERKIEEEALKGKSGFSKYLAKRQVKKQAVANVRTAPAKELAGPSKNIFATGSAMELMSFGKDFGKAGGATDITETSTDRFVPIVPSLADTLAAPFLRKFFENTFLGTVMSATDITLWEALTEFFIKYSTMDYDKVAEAQSEMRKDIIAICDKYHSMLKNSEEIKTRAKEAKVIFPQFFRPYEMELYADAHEAFEKTLHEKGWK